MVGLPQSSLSLTVQTVFVYIDQIYSGRSISDDYPDSKELWITLGWSFIQVFSQNSQAMAHVAREMLKKELCQLMKVWNTVWNTMWNCEMHTRYAQYAHLMGVSYVHQGNFEQKCGYPIPILASLGWEQWLLCWSGWWLGDAMHFCYGCECLTVKS